MNNDRLFSDDLSCHPRHQLWIKNWLNKSFHSKFSKFCPWIQLNPTGIQLFLPPAPTWVQICGSGETSASLHTPSLTLHSAKCPHLCPNFPNFAFFKTHIIWFSFLAFFTIISDDYHMPTRPPTGGMEHDIDINWRIKQVVFDRGDLQF